MKLTDQPASNRERRQSYRSSRYLCLEDIKVNNRNKMLSRVGKKRRTKSLSTAKKLCGSKFPTPKKGEGNGPKKISTLEKRKRRIGLYSLGGYLHGKSNLSEGLT